MPDEKIGNVTIAISEDSDHHVRVAVKDVQDEMNKLVSDINSKAVFPDADTGNVASDGAIIAHSDTAIPVGGAVGTGVLVSSTPNFGLFFGSGAPAIAAAKGALYMRSDGTTTNNRMYVNTDGGTTWTAVNTVA